MDAWRAARTREIGVRQSSSGTWPPVRPSSTNQAELRGPPMSRILPAAEQLLTGGREAELEPSGERSYLDRPCQEYRFALAGREEGIPYRSEVTWLVAGPYVLVRDVGTPASSSCGPAPRWSSWTRLGSPTRGAAPLKPGRRGRAPVSPPGATVLNVAVSSDPDSEIELARRRGEPAARCIDRAAE
jgi:hypothetical protein